MKFVIKHEIRGRLRIHLYQREMRYPAGGSAPVLSLYTDRGFVRLRYMRERPMR